MLSCYFCCIGQFDRVILKISRITLTQANSRIYMMCTDTSTIYVILCILLYTRCTLKALCILKYTQTSILWR